MHIYEPLFCPGCRRRIDYDPKASTRQVDCPDCGRAVPLPVPREDAAKPRSAAAAAPKPHASGQSAAAKVRCNCPHCQQRLAVPVSLANRVTICPKCRTPFDASRVADVSPVIPKATQVQAPAAMAGPSPQAPSTPSAAPVSSPHGTAGKEPIPPPLPVDFKAGISPAKSIADQTAPDAVDPSTDGEVLWMIGLAGLKVIGFLCGLTGWVYFAGKLLPISRSGGFVAPLGTLLCYPSILLAMLCGTALAVQRTQKMWLKIPGIALTCCTLYWWSTYDTYTYHWASDSGQEFTDTRNCWSNALVFRDITIYESDDQMPDGKTRSLTTSGPMAGTGKPHGEWSVVYWGPFRSETKFFWFGEEVSEGEWHLRNK